MLKEVIVQREIVRLLNKWSEGYETTLLKMFAEWCNKNLISNYEIVEIQENYGVKNMWELREKK